MVWKESGGTFHDAGADGVATERRFKLIRSEHVAIPRATRCASIAEAKLIGAKKLRQAQKRQEERSARGEL